MRLFFKHLLRSVRGKPTQPLILILTISLCVVMITGTLTIKEGLIEERRLVEEAKVGSAELKITLTGNSDTRFMFTEDVKRVLGEKTEVTGYYDVLMSSEEGDPIFSVAVDFTEAHRILDFKFTEYSPVPETERAHAAFISREFAKNNSLGIGDEVVFRLFGKEKTYTVYGISPTGFLGSSPVMVDISSIVRALASSSAFAAAIGEDFKPYSTLLVDLSDGAEVAKAFSLLKADEAFSDRNVEDVSHKGYSGSSDKILDVLISFVVALSCILSSVVCYACFAILSSERCEENYVFVAAGAKPSLLALMQYAEGILYWLCGSVVGVIICPPILELSRVVIGFNYAVCHMKPANTAISCLIALASVVFTVTVFVFSSGKERKRNAKWAFPLVFVLALILSLACFTAPLKLRIVFTAAATAAILVFIFLLSSRLLKILLKSVKRALDQRIAEGKDALKPSLSYALKNMLSVRQLHNVTGMLALLVGTVLAICYAINGLDGNAKTVERMINADYVVLNGTERCYEKIDSLDSVESVTRLYLSQTRYEDSADTNFLSVSDKSALGEHIPVSKLPKGNEAVISYAEAKCHSLSVGDSFTVFHNDIELDLVVSEIVKTRYYFVLFNCENFGIEYNMLVPNRNEEVSEEKFLEEVTVATTEEIASVAETDKLFEQRKTLVKVYSGSGDVLLASVIIFSVIGIINSLLECYRSRREELRLYRTAGMTAADVRRMKLFEILLTVIYALLLGVFGFGFILLIMNEGLLSMGFDLFRNNVGYLEYVFGL